MTDYYSTLGVPKGASADEIKKAYRKMAAKHHPDRGGDTAQFQKVEEAYRVLSDPNQRQSYDNPQPEFSDPFGPFMNSHGFHDIFRQFNFGDVFGQHRHQPARNRTVNITAGITLEDAFNGKELLANVTLPSGKEQMINVKIPPGVDSGTTLRLAGMGEDSIPGAPRGDIHMTINVLPHHMFQRHGEDLITEVNIPIWTAILGGAINIKTIDGKDYEMAVPEGTQFGTTLNMNGGGMPRLNSPAVRGRLLVKLNLSVPTNLTEEQKQIIRAVSN